MRKVYRLKRRKVGVGASVAIWGASVFSVAVCGNVATANGNGIANGNAPSTANANGDFWPRLGAGAATVFGEDVRLTDARLDDFRANGGGQGEPTANAAISQGRVESANFVGYSADSGFAEQERSVSGRTRLVDWSTLDPTTQRGDASVGVANRTPETPSTAPPGGTSSEVGGLGRVGETAKVGATTPIGETAKVGATTSIGETRKVGENNGNLTAASRSKTPILRDEPVAPARNGGSLGSALVSTFGALAVVLGAFFALVALLKRTGPRTGGGSALEIVDSTPVGDKARLLTIRWGNRLILAAKTPEKIAPLAEITDVEEASAMLAELERRKESASSGDVGARAAAIWKLGRAAASVWRTAFEAKGRRR